MATTTTRLGLIEPATADGPSELRLAINNNAVTLDSAALYLSGTLASRPAASAVVAGTFYDATDTGILSKSNHTAWVNVAQLDSGGHVPLGELSGITHTQLDAAAGITGSQLAAAAGIVGSQLSATAGIVDAQITHGAWVGVSLAGGLSGVVGFYGPQARLEGDVVRLRGAIKNLSGVGISIGNLAFTLPTGTSPASNVQFVVAMDSSVVGIGLDIAGGTSTVANAGPIWPNNAIMFLDGATYNRV